MKISINYIVAGIFVALIFFTIITITTVLPAMTFTPEPSDAAFDYSKDPLVAKGRDIYRREGCFYCHSQFTRYQDREAGELVKAGDYVYETPNLLGTERTGPDLSNVGGKYPSAWHVTHHTNPRFLKPGSIMPSFSYLSHDDMTALVAYLQTLGAKRQQPHWVSAPQEYRDIIDKLKKEGKVNLDSSAVANAGRGIFAQNCTPCHGFHAEGNGPISLSMIKKPANLTRPFYKNYDDAMWYWRVAEGVAGTRMPRWARTLNQEDILYLVAYLKTLPKESQTYDQEIHSFEQIDKPAEMSKDFDEVSKARETADDSGVAPFKAKQETK